MKRTFKRKSYAKKSSKTPLKKMIRREIARNVENKVAEIYNGSAQYFSSNSANWITSNVVPMGFVPTALTVNQGVSQGQRVGNKIKVKKLFLKGTLIPEDYSATSNSTPCPVQVRLLFISDRAAPASVPGSLTDLFQFGGTTQGPLGNLTDMWAPVNTDRYSVHASKTFKLGPASLGNSTAAQYPNGTSAPGANSNNDFKLNQNFHFDIKKMLPEFVTFNDNTTAATSRVVSMVVLIARADAALYAAGQLPVVAQYMVHCEYEDA